ncbi:MAG: TSUP family transporter [Gammaproteobacteria bacterium]|nr:TSUP family transporter [Gammaproteobacteria bacterium]
MDLSLSALALLFVVATFGAFISSIAGAGGLIVLPVLLWLGVPPVNALATNKVQSVFGTLSSAVNYFRNGQIQFDTLIPAMLWAVPGAVAGTLLIQSMDAGVLESLLPFLLIVVALYLAFSPRISDRNSPPRLGKHGFGALVGGGAGFYGGFFGPGMGSFCAAAFAGLRGYNMRRATAHTKPLVLMTNFVSVVVFISGGHVLWSLALVMALGQIIGARLGSGLVLKHGARLVKPVIISLTLIIAVKLLYE